MFRQILKTGITLIACNALAYAPLLYAEQLSLPSGDLVAPDISQEKYEDTVNPGSDHEIMVKVTDNIGVDKVILYFRTIGQGDYKPRTMQRLDHSDNYMIRIDADNIQSPGIEYYIQAMDFAGNTLLHGHSFSPLSVKIGSTAAKPQVADSSEVAPKVAMPGAEKGISKWVWIGLGVLLVGAAAGGSDGGGETTGTLTITAIEPNN